MACSVKGCPFPEVHWLKDINETIPVCSQHGEFYHEEVGYFDANIRLSLLSHSGSSSSLRAAIQDSLHPNVGFRMRMPSRKTGRLNISSWADKAAARRERERIADRVFAQRMERREARFARREERLLVAIERCERTRRHYFDLHIQAKWTPLAEKLGRLEVGQDFFVLHSRPAEYARQARNNLNSNRASRCVPRSIISRPTGVIVRRVAEFGHFSKERWAAQRFQHEGNWLTW